MTDALEDRVRMLEASLSKEREAQEILRARIEAEAFERKEALLWQEHRIPSALRSIYTYRSNKALRLAAVGGLISALLGRSATAVAIGSGLIALGLTTLLALQANYLLSIQNEKMDVQTIVMDAQRRTREIGLICACTSSAWPGMGS